MLEQEISAYERVVAKKEALLLRQKAVDAEMKFFEEEYWEKVRFLIDRLFDFSRARGITIIVRGSQLDRILVGNDQLDKVKAEINLGYNDASDKSHLPNHNALDIKILTADELILQEFYALIEAELNLSEIKTFNRPSATCIICLKNSIPCVEHSEYHSMTHSYGISEEKAQIPIIYFRHMLQRMMPNGLPSAMHILGGFTISIAGSTDNRLPNRCANVDSLYATVTRRSRSAHLSNVVWLADDFDLELPKIPEVGFIPDELLTEYEGYFTKFALQIKKAQDENDQEKVNLIIQEYQMLIYNFVEIVLRYIRKLCSFNTVDISYDKNNSEKIAQLVRSIGPFFKQYIYTTDPIRHVLNSTELLVATKLNGNLCLQLIKDFAVYELLSDSEELRPFFEIDDESWFSFLMAYNAEKNQFYVLESVLRMYGNFNVSNAFQIGGPIRKRPSFST